MDKNTITGFILIAAVLFGFAWWQQPSAEQMAEIARQDSIAKIEQKAAEALKKQQMAQKVAMRDSVEKDTSAIFYSALNGESQKVVLKNNKLELTLNSKGATVEKAVVKNFK